MHQSIRSLKFSALLVLVAGSCSSRAGSFPAGNTDTASTVSADLPSDEAAPSRSSVPVSANDTVEPTGIADEGRRHLPSPRQKVKQDFVQLLVSYPDGVRLTLQGDEGQFDTSKGWVVPARINLPAGRKYRFKLDQMPGRGGATLFPTIEIPAATAATSRFFEKDAIVFGITEEEFDRILSGNSMTKVVYNPDPEFAEQDRPLSIEGGINSWTSNFMFEGVLDPIEQADDHGDVLAIIEIGTIDLEVE